MIYISSVDKEVVAVPFVSGMNAVTFPKSRSFGIIFSLTALDDEKLQSSLVVLYTISLSVGSALILSCYFQRKLEMY
ncbi:hypothetical protein ACJX0J_036612, partial [Zea mays]